MRSGRSTTVGKGHVHRAFENKIKCMLPAPKSPARAVRYVVSRLDTTKISSHLGGWAPIFRSAWWRGGYGGINGGLRELELAAESRKATLGSCARSTSTSLLTSSRPKGGSTTTTTMVAHASGGAARFGGRVIRRISRRR
jgi:hypothetical protein